ncbi:hypothetical protein MC885_015945 [Smutsia gigantea]|nr:hypothetical protein MC885_015945 [Smutsia gigantea]
MAPSCHVHMILRCEERQGPQSLSTGLLKEWWAAEATATGGGTEPQRSGQLSQLLNEGKGETRTVMLPGGLLGDADDDVMMMTI